MCVNLDQFYFRYECHDYEDPGLVKRAYAHFWNICYATAPVQTHSDMFAYDVHSFDFTGDSERVNPLDSVTGLRPRPFL